MGENSLRKVRTFIFLINVFNKSHCFCQMQSKMSLILCLSIFISVRHTFFVLSNGNSKLSVGYDIEVEEVEAVTLRFIGPRTNPVAYWTKYKLLFIKIMSNKYKIWLFQGKSQEVLSLTNNTGNFRKLQKWEKVSFPVKSTPISCPAPKSQPWKHTFKTFYTDWTYIHGSML